MSRKQSFDSDALNDSKHLFDVPDFFDRMTPLSITKQLMIDNALSYIPKNGTVFIDVSTSLFYLSQKLTFPCRVVTHSLDNAFVLAQKDQVELVVLGGTLDYKNRFFSSDSLCEQLDFIKIDVAFLGAASIEQDGFYVKESRNAQLKRHVISRSRACILVAENNKFNRTSTFKGGNMEDIDVFITDKSLSLKQEALFLPTTSIITNKEGIL